MAAPPPSLPPQHDSRPPLRRAHALALPAATAVARSIATAVGTSTLGLGGCPACPPSLSPKHDTCAPSSSTQVTSRPAAAATTCVPSDATTTGSLVVAVMPSPSCPALSVPQHTSLRSRPTAHVCVAPAVSAPTDNGAPALSTTS